MRISLRWYSRSKHFFTPILFLGVLNAYPQSGHYILGARSAGMGQTSVANRDTWSLLNNPAGLSDLHSSTAVFTYQMRYALSGLNTLSAGYVKPFSFANLGISMYRFGDQIFSEQKLALSGASQVGFVSLGTTINYLQFRFEGFGAKQLISLDFGGTVSLGDDIVFGAHVTNINQAKISQFENEDLPTIMRVGISYSLIEALIFNLELEKDLDFPEKFKAGIEYRFYKEFYARTGFHAPPFIPSFGLGFKSGRIDVDYAFSAESNLGDIHQASVSYQFAKK